MLFLAVVSEATLSSVPTRADMEETTGFEPAGRFTVRLFSKQVP